MLERRPNRSVSWLVIVERWAVDVDGAMAIHLRYRIVGRMAQVMDVREQRAVGCSSCRTSK